eukprot:c8686_g1_i1.p1 GENE.c8686_g1_i1~~c8686_g1_i1.p1  ORF type:complete len:349 (+),score=76.65 c8686_g1_i1:37-1083(+)
MHLVLVLWCLFCSLVLSDAYPTQMTPSAFEAIRHEKGLQHLHHSFPVDVVITWYNSKDATARKLYKSRLATVDKSKIPPGTLNAKRHNDAGELLFNLRALEQHANWIRNVFIVVADDMALPTWLKIDKKNLRIIRHSQIFSSSSCLPTFNSHAIESRLHHIPGLAEHFLYLNDDMFINQKVYPRTFFGSDGRPIVWTGWAVDFQSDHAHWVAIQNALKLITPQRWPRSLSIHHHVKALKKSAFFEIEVKFALKMRETECQPFRTKTDIWPIYLASVFCVEQGDCNYSTNPPSSYYYEALPSTTVWNAISEIQRTRPTFVCLNDSGPEDAAALESALKTHFSRKSGYEW